MELSQLYYRYGKTSDEDIRRYLSNIKIVVREHKGIGSLYGYYPLNKESIDKILENPRNVSLTFDATITSSSRFFLKPDIGEVFDQIDFHDLFGDKIKAICVDEGYETLPGTEGEHFLMIATLFN